MTIRTLALCAAVGAAAPVASAMPLVDFETYNDNTPIENGRQLSTILGQYEMGLFTLNTGISSSDNTNGGSRVAIFDSDTTGPNQNSQDPDLLVDCGNILIVQNDGGSSLTQGTSGIYDSPNDDAGGGVISFDFTFPSELESMKLVDINGNAALTIELLDMNGLTRTYSVPSKWTNDPTISPLGYDTLLFTTLADQDGEGVGGPATATEQAGFDPTIVTRMTVNFSGSAGLDDLMFVPSPASGALLVFGALAVSRRRRS